MVQRKQLRRIQTGPPAEVWETDLSQRGKKPSSECSKGELMTIFGTVFLLLYILLCYENFHFHVAHMYAHLGYPDAQHIVGQRYLKGAGVQKNTEKAMQWFSQAAEHGHPHSSFNLAVGRLKNLTVGLEQGQAAEHGHPHSSFNLAVGRLKNLTVGLEQGEVEKLLNIAAGHGLQEAQNLLENIRNRNQP